MNGNKVLDKDTADAVAAMSERTNEELKERIARFARIAEVLEIEADDKGNIALDVILFRIVNRLQAMERAIVNLIAAGDDKPGTEGSYNPLTDKL